MVELKLLYTTLTLNDFCFFQLVDEKQDLVFCLKHGIQYLKEPQRASFSKLLYRFDEVSYELVLKKMRMAIHMSKYFYYMKIFKALGNITK